MTASIARYLRDFGEPQPAAPPTLGEDFGAGFPDEIASFPAVLEEPVDIEAERAEAYAKGHEAASEELQRQWAEEREQLLATHATELLALREELEVQAAAAIETRLREIAGATAEAVGSQTARMLAPLLDEALAGKAVAELAELVRAAALEGEVGTLTVRGPAGLYEKLKSALGEAIPLRHVEAPDLDITLDIGETVLVTRMSAWASSLKKVLG